MILNKIINENKIKIVNTVDTWENSIKMAGKLLVDSNSISTKYIVKIIENIKKIGFYIILDEYIAMPHARPENGVYKNDVALLKVNDGIMYGENKIYLIFILSATDSNSHIELIKGLMEIFDNKIMVEKIINAKTIEDIKEVV